MISSGLILVVFPEINKKVAVFMDAAVVIKRGKTEKSFGLSGVYDWLSITMKIFIEDFSLRIKNIQAFSKVSSKFWRIT